MKFYKACILSDNMIKRGNAVGHDIWYCPDKNLVIEKYLERNQGKDLDGNRLIEDVTKIYSLSSLTGSSIILNKNKEEKSFESIVWGE